MSESSPPPGFVFLILTRNSNSDVLKDWNPLNPKYPSCLSILITCLSRYTEQDGMVDQVFPPIGKDGFDPDFRIQVLPKPSALTKSYTISLSSFPMSGWSNLTCLISGVLHLWVLERGIAWDWPGRSGRHYSPESRGRQGLENLKTSTSCPHVVKSLRKKTNNATIHINGQTLLREPRNFPKSTSCHIW